MVEKKQINFPRYEQYKDSGIEWIGEIPAHWDACKIKNIMIMVGRGTTPNYVDYSDYYVMNQATFSRGYWDFKNIRYTSKPENSRGRVLKGDVLLASTGGGVLGKVAYYDINEEHTFIADSHVTILRANTESYESKYAYYFLSINYDLINGLLAQGATNQIELQTDWMRNFLLPVPPLKEQTAIAQFLDHKTAQIDRAIAIKEAQIKLLNERKQIMIQEAVTKGLDPSVPMKDSGVEWIGEIPEHWSVSKVKHTLSIPITDGPHETPELLDSGIPFISAEAVSQGYINFDKKRGYIGENDYKKFSKKYKPLKYDVYLIKSGATTGVSAIVETDKVFTIWSPLAVFRASEKLNPYYLLNYLRSYSFQKAIELNWTYGTQQNIGMKTLGNLYIAYPDRKEQSKILDYLNLYNKDLQKSIENIKNQIQTLKEYKTTLINEAVTGKIKVY